MPEIASVRPMMPVQLGVAAGSRSAIAVAHQGEPFPRVGEEEGLAEPAAAEAPIIACAGSEARNATNARASPGFTFRCLAGLTTYA